MSGLHYWIERASMIIPRRVYTPILPFQIRLTAEDFFNIVLFNDDYHMSFEEVIEWYKDGKQIGDAAIRKWVRQQIGRR